MPTTNNHARFVSFLRRMSDILRDAISRRHYPDILVGFLLMRRIDCSQVCADPEAGNGFGLPSRRKGTESRAMETTFDRLLDDPSHLAANIQRFIDEQAGDLRDILSHLQMPRMIAMLEEAGLLTFVVEAFCSLDLTPGQVSNQDLGAFFEEILYSLVPHANDWAAYFTPKDVIGLIAALVAAQDPRLGEPNARRSVYDCCCGSGGLLIGVREGIEQLAPGVQVALYGQELNPETYALCRADLSLRQRDGQTSDIRLGNTLSADGFSGRVFDFLTANPPFGVSWKGCRALVEQEARLGVQGRFPAGLPSVSDGQLLFLQHLIAHMKPVEDGGSLIAIVMNGSPLFSGGAGSGENSVRRFVLERDLLSAIIALPEHLFQNTGMATYLWLLSNRKPPARQGLVQVIDAREWHRPLRRNQGEKRRELSPEHISALVDLFLTGAEGEHSRMCPAASFGSREIVVERPLRLRFQVTTERLARLAQLPIFQDQEPVITQPALWQGTGDGLERSRLQAISDVLTSLPHASYRDRAAFLEDVCAAAGVQGVRLTSAEMDAVLLTLGEHDETAEPCVDARGNPEADPELRDHERVPLGEDLSAFFAREVLPYVPDAWINPTYCDALDGQIGKVGYEINVGKLFHRYEPLRDPEEIMKEILALEEETRRLLRGIIGDF